MTSKMAFSRTCMQWTVIVFNALSLIIGILAVVFCIYELEKFAVPENIVQLAAASLMVLSTFVGCFGAVNGSARIVCCFITMLLGTIASHIWKLWSYSEVKRMTDTKKMLTAAWSTKLKTDAMSVIQETYKCCGVAGSSDYLKINVTVPPSCYRYQNDLRNVYPYNEGCEVALKRAYLAMYRYERLAHALLIGFEGIGILLALLLICKLLTKSSRYNYR